MAAQARWTAGPAAVNQNDSFETDSSTDIHALLRVEAFNVLNHPNFANPTDTGHLNSVAVGGQNFGAATASLASGLSPTVIPAGLNPLFKVGNPRIIQIALRLKF